MNIPPVDFGKAERFEITIRNLQDRTFTFTVATRLSEAKAIAIAVVHYKAEHPTLDDEIFTVDIKKLGNVPPLVDEHGRLQSFDLHDHDLVDVVEWH